MPEPATLMPEVGAPENVAHVIQVALTPVFLLTGVSGLLNVFNARLTRIAGRADDIVELLRNSTDESERVRLQTQFTQLARRIFALEVAIALGALGGAATGGAAFTLFIGAMRDAVVGSTLFILFGCAVVCIILALAAFLTETFLAWRELQADGRLFRPSLIDSKRTPRN
jgi:hypothetical protein